MPRDSKLMAAIKEEQMLLYEDILPEKRLEAAIKHNQLLRELCFARLSKKGFSEETLT
jgi:hypothetical protein